MTFPLKLRTGQKCLLWPLLVQHIVGEVLATAIRQERKKKDKKIEKEEIKVFLFADGMIIYIENAKKSIHTNTHTTNLLELINYFSEVTGYKINIPKSVLFLYGS